MSTAEPTQTDSAAAPSWRPPVLEVTPAPVHRLFEEAVEDFPDNVYLSYRDHHLTYAQAARAVARLAAALQMRGVEKGDRIGVCLPTGPTFPLVALAVWTVGGVTVGMNPLYASDTLARQASDSGMRLLFTVDNPELRGKLAPLEALGVQIVYAAADAMDVLHPWEGSDALAMGGLAAFVHGAGAPRPVRIEPETDLAALQFTGGTTGEPKGAMHTHAALYISNRQMRLNLPQLTRGEVTTAVVSPFSHIGALQAGLNLVTTLAGRLILLDRFEPAEFLRILQDERVNYFPGVPTMLTALLALPEIETADLSSLRAVTNGAAPPPVEAQRRFQALSGVVLQPTYGLTETSMCVAGPWTGRPDFAAAGLPLAGVRVEIRDPQDPARRLPDGEVGEICVDGPQNMLGYWNRPEATAQVKVDGMVRTGDLGRKDPDGFIYVLDRLKDVIISNGFNVYPTAVEDAVYQHPAVRECMIVGLPDPRRGEVVVACVALREDAELDLATLQAFLAPRLSPMEIPRRLVVRAALPRTAVAKLSRQMLRDELLTMEA